MKVQNNRFYFELAKPQDNKEILDILEESEFKGKISMIYTRRPDAYNSFMNEGDKTILITCRDKLNGNILAGFGICIINEYFINGKKENVAYLTGLRAKKEYINSLQLGRIIATLVFFLIPIDLNP